MSTTNTTGIKVGDVGFGAVGGYPPARWRYAGKRNGSHMLEHVKHPSATAGFPPQGVDWATVGRIMKG